MVEWMCAGALSPSTFAKRAHAATLERSDGARPALRGGRGC